MLHKEDQDHLDQDQMINVLNVEEKDIGNKYIYIIIIKSIGLMNVIDLDQINMVVVDLYQEVQVHLVEEEGMIEMIEDQEEIIEELNDLDIIHLIHHQIHHHLHQVHLNHHQVVVHLDQKVLKEKKVQKKK